MRRHTKTLLIEELLYIDVIFLPLSARHPQDGCTKTKEIFLELVELKIRVFKSDFNSILFIEKSHICLIICYFYRNAFVTDVNLSHFVEKYGFKINNGFKNAQRPLRVKG